MTKFTVFREISYHHLDATAYLIMSRSCSQICITFAMKFFIMRLPFGISFQNSQRETFTMVHVDGDKSTYGFFMHQN